MEQTTHTRSRHARGKAAALVAGIGLALTVVLAGCGGSSSAVQSVDPQTFSTVVAEPGVVIVDVRTPAEFAEGHLPGAVNIDFEGADFAGQIQTLDKSAHIAVYCRSGNRSGQATAQMADLGFANITNLDGGVIDWTAAGGQLVTQ